MDLPQKANKPRPLNSTSTGSWLSSSLSETSLDPSLDDKDELCMIWSKFLLPRFYGGAAFSVCSACVTIWRWKSAADLPAGTVSWRQETVSVNAVAALVARQTVNRPRLLRGNSEHDFSSFRSRFAKMNIAPTFWTSRHLKKVGAIFINVFFVFFLRFIVWKSSEIRFPFRTCLWKGGCNIH